MKRATWSRPAALLLVVALAAAACGGDDDKDDAGGKATPGAPVATTGFDGTTIKVGALTPQSGGVEVIGIPLTNGNKAYFDHVNAAGGIAGKYKIELVEADTQYDPTTAASKYLEMKDSVALFAQILGTAVTDRLLGDLEDDNVIGLPASLDSKWVREAHLMPVGAPYQLQAINSIDWYFSQAENKDDTLCALASTDEYGDAGLAGIDYIAGKLGIDVAAKAEFPAPGKDRPKQTFQSQLSSLKAASCEVIFFVGTPTDTGSLATTLGESPDYTPTIIGQSPTWLTAFAAFPYLQQHFLLASEGTEYGDTSVPGMAQLQQVLTEFAAKQPDPAKAQKPDIYFNFGYLQGIATVKLLEKAVELGDLSRAGLAKALDELGTVDFGGLTGSYKYGPPDDRVPPISSSIYKPNKDKPGGLQIVEQGYTADSAKDFEL